MKKRLRKKLRIGEFTEYGFELEIILKPVIFTDEDMDRAFDSVIGVIEDCGLRYGGSVSEFGFLGYVYKKGSCTEADRKQLNSQLLALDLVVGTFVSELIPNEY